MEVIATRRAQHVRASTGIRSPRSCGSPTTAATGWATTRPKDELNRMHQDRPELRLPVLPCQRRARPGHQEGQSVRRRDAAGATMGPHAAAMGVHFYTGNMFPAEYQNVLFVARKGSWNRTKKMRLRRGDGAAPMPTAATRRSTPFMTGFLDPAADNVQRAARPTSCRCPTARCWCPTSSSARSTASATAADRAVLNTVVRLAGPAAASLLLLLPLAAAAQPKRRDPRRLRRLPRAERQLAGTAVPVAGRTAQRLRREPARADPRGHARRTGHEGHADRHERRDHRRAGQATSPSRSRYRAKGPCDRRAFALARNYRRRCCAALATARTTPGRTRYRGWRGSRRLISSR